MPKLLGLVLALLNPGLRSGCGRLSFFLSAQLELLFSVLYAPLFMLIHSGHLWEIARGQDSGWSAQQRQNMKPKWRQLLARHGAHTIVGLLILAVLLWLPSSLLYWMLPIVVRPDHGPASFGLERQYGGGSLAGAGADC